MDDLKAASSEKERLLLIKALEDVFGTCVYKVGTFYVFGSTARAVAGQAHDLQASAALCGGTTSYHDWCPAGAEMSGHRGGLRRVGNLAYPQLTWSIGMVDTDQAGDTGVRRLCIKEREETRGPT